VHPSRSHVKRKDVLVLLCVEVVVEGEFLLDRQDLAFGDVARKLHLLYRIRLESGSGRAVVHNPRPAGRIRTPNVICPALGAGSKYKKLLLNDDDFMNEYKLH